MRAIYIILMGLPCWARLSRWIPLKVALPNFLWWINFTDLGLSVNCNSDRPSAKFPWYGSAIGQIPVVSVVSAKWVVGLVISAKSLKARLGSPGLGQVDSVSGSQMGLGLAHTSTLP